MQAIIITDGTPKEIAALALAVQGRHEDVPYSMDKAIKDAVSRLQCL